MTQQTAERAETVRDLRDQIGRVLTADEEREFIFRETTPRRRMVMLYSMENGEEVRIPQAMMEVAINKRLPDGRYMFTARREQAPLYKRGEVKCFMHPDAPDRQILEEIGLGGLNCPAAHLANSYSKRIHAMHRHRQEWAAYQEHLSEISTEDERRQRKLQLDATLAIAGMAAAEGQQTKATRAKPSKTEMCELCSAGPFSKSGLRLHKFHVHNEA